MKRVITLLMAFCSIASLHATEPTTVYCTISGSHLATTPNGYIGQVDIDFGESQSSRDYLVDESGKRLNFDTMIAALNYMSKAGWQLESTYTRFAPSIIKDSGLDKYVIVMILSKRVTSEEQIAEGICTHKIYKSRD